VADRPLRPATRRSLGEPLPHQQADRSRAHPEAEAEATFAYSTYVLQERLVLAPVSRSYPSPQGRLPTCYSPVRRSTGIPKDPFALDLHVLGTPPAFVLSQDQTLHEVFMIRTEVRIKLLKRA
jgi:hypothetical protein